MKIPQRVEQHHQIQNLEDCLNCGFGADGALAGNPRQHFDWLFDHFITLIDEDQGDHVTKCHGIRAEGKIALNQICPIKFETGIEVFQKAWTSSSPQSCGSSIYPIPGTSGPYYSTFSIRLPYRHRSSVIFRTRWGMSFQLVLPVGIKSDGVLRIHCCQAGLQCATISAVYLMMKYFQPRLFFEWNQNSFCIVLWNHH